ncbi:uncharacterized protein [Antedon mediterranea]|uniref:uncharacterized protein n=1 Tax=Antedon mediterranea TaxID=105859 RepID=UPI003AF90F34
MFFLNLVTLLCISISLMFVVQSTDTDNARQKSNADTLDYHALFRKFIGSKPFLIPDEHFQFMNRPDGRRLKDMTFSGFFDTTPMPLADSEEPFVKQDNTRGLGSLNQIDYNPSDWNSFVFSDDIQCVQRMQGTSCRSNADCLGCGTPFVCSWVGICNEAFPFRKRSGKQTRGGAKNILWSRMKPRSVK